MTTLTTLPLSLQSRILQYLYDVPYCEEQRTQPFKLNGFDYYLPLRNPETRISLDRMRIVNASLPKELLSPALASPSLATAAYRILEYGIPYLTDANTNGRLAAWVNAFHAFVQAVAITDIGEAWRNSLPEDLGKSMAEKLCFDTVDLFREISSNHVRLKVLDLVNAPFDSCEGMQDVLITGLFSTLETCQSTLKELALPVYPKSDICARALETATLPCLTLLSVELKDKRNSRKLSAREKSRLGRQFLRMMQAVDGHADREKGLTTLEELRLINLHDVPCTKVTSGCSTGFFQAIMTLRVSMSHFFTETDLAETLFFSMFSKLECLYWTGLWCYRHDLEKLCGRLKEFHFCHHHWIEGAQVGAKLRANIIRSWEGELMCTVSQSRRKIRTLVWYNELYPFEIERIWRNCPNLQYLSLYVRQDTIHDLANCVQKCEGLIGLEICIDERLRRGLGQDGWRKLGEAIPRGHANLRELAIQTRPKAHAKAVRMNIAIDCLIDVVERMGAHLEKLAFRATLQFKSIPQTLNEICRVVDACLKHSHSLMFLEVYVLPCRCLLSATDICEMDLACVDNIKTSTQKLIQSRPRLTKIDLGAWHRFLIIHDADPVGE